MSEARELTASRKMPSINCLIEIFVGSDPSSDLCFTIRYHNTMRRIHTAKEAGAALRRGEVIAMPTDTVYGLIAVANKKAQKKIVAIKQSPRDKKILLLVNSIASAKKIAHISARHEKFLRLVWPGPVTAILKSRKNIPGFEGSTLAVRIPKTRLLQTIMRSVRHPLTATSANLSGEQTPHSYRDVID